MKKVFALLLCLSILLVLPAGCKKDDQKSVPVHIELTNDIISGDLAKHSGYYNLSFTEGDYVISNLKVLDKAEKDNTATVTANATATNPYLRAAFTAKMNYELVGDQWKLLDVEMSNTSYTVMGAPNRQSALEAIGNYSGAVDSMLGIRGEEIISLKKLNLQAITWDLTYDKATKTAKITATLEDKTVSLKGYYKLSFGERGWSIETKEKDGLHHYAMYLETYELKEAESDKK